MSAQIIDFISAIKQNPASIVDAFKREAHNAMTLKKLDL